MDEMKPYQDLYSEIRNTLLSSRRQAYQAVNTSMVQAYWNIGRIIVEYEQKGNERAEYGKGMIKTLSTQLSEEFGTGFDKRNLRNMRRFYLCYPKWNAVRSELSWTHYRLLLKVDDPVAREWYMKEAITSVWSSRQLDRQIASLYYERLLASKEKQPVIDEARTLLSSITAENYIAEK